MASSVSTSNGTPSRDVVPGATYTNGVYGLTCEAYSNTPQPPWPTVGPATFGHGPQVINIEFNILAGPRPVCLKNALASFIQWYNESAFGSRTDITYHVHVAIVRVGEFNESFWGIPSTPKMESFLPLKDFVEKLVRFLPQGALFEWSAPEQQIMALRRYAHSKAPLAVRAGHGNQPISIERYSEAIDGKILRMHVPVLHPQAKSFMPVCDAPIRHRANLRDEDPFKDQIKEVDDSRRLLGMNGATSAWRTLPALGMAHMSSFYPQAPAMSHTRNQWTVGASCFVPEVQGHGDGHGNPIANGVPNSAQVNNGPGAIQGGQPHQGGFQANLNNHQVSATPASTSASTSARAPKKNKKKNKKKAKSNKKKENGDNASNRENARYRSRSLVLI